MSIEDELRQKCRACQMISLIGFVLFIIGVSLNILPIFIPIVFTIYNIYLVVFLMVFGLGGVYVAFYNYYKFQRRLKFGCFYPNLECKSRTDIEGRSSEGMYCLLKVRGNQLLFGPPDPAGTLLLKSIWHECPGERNEKT